MKVKIYVSLLLIIFFGLGYYLYLIKGSNEKLIVKENLMNDEKIIIDKNDNDNDENNIKEVIINYKKNKTPELILNQSNTVIDKTIIDNYSNYIKLLPFSVKPYGMDIDFGNGYFYENNIYSFEIRKGEYFMKLGEKKIIFFITDNKDDIVIKIIEDGEEYELGNYGTFSRTPQGTFNIKEYENGDLLFSEIEDIHYPKNFVYYTSNKGFININDEVNKLVGNAFPGNTIKKIGRNLIIESVKTFDVGEKDYYKIILNLDTYITKLL